LEAEKTKKTPTIEKRRLGSVEKPDDSRKVTTEKASSEMQETNNSQFSRALGQTEDDSDVLAAE
jgi:hypothetical protein